MCRRIAPLATLILVLGLISRGHAAEEVVTIQLRDGSRLVGRVVSDDGVRMKLVTATGIAVEIPRAEVVTTAGAPDTAEPKIGRDPNHSRLLFAPTGRPLKKGDGYFSDYELLFPGLAYGLTNNVSLAGGVSFIPGLGLDEQLFYISPKIGWDLGRRTSVSVGALFAGTGGGGDEFDGDAESVGIGFGVATFGTRETSASVGFGVGRASGGSKAVPIVMLGGTATVSRHVALVGEAWLVMTDDFRLADQPFGIGIRLFGDRLSADVGAILVGELLQEGFPIPWVSVTYHFGPGGAKAAVRR